MVAAWFVLHTILVRRGRPGWLPLAVCVAVVLAKRIAWHPSLLGLAVVAPYAAVCGLRWSGQNRPTWQRRCLTAIVPLWVALGVFAWEWEAAATCGRIAKLHGNRPVVCIGDSLTSGVLPDGGYPAVLQKLISLPVVDLSQQGITSGQALKKLPELIAANPQVVIVELGGHDYLKGHVRATTYANLEQIVLAARELGAEVVVMEIPRSFIWDPFGGLERELARRHDLELISDTVIRELVLWSPFAPPGMWFGEDVHLSDDGLHPNGRGNRRLADAVVGKLVRLYGEHVLANQGK